MVNQAGRLVEDSSAAAWRDTKAHFGEFDSNLAGVEWQIHHIARVADAEPSDLEHHGKREDRRVV
jgi:hypothetical protein